MSKLGHFSGTEVCRILEQHGFHQVRQRGSHAKTGWNVNRDRPGADASLSAYWDVNVDRAPVRCAEVGVRGVKIGLLLICRTDPRFRTRNG